MHICVCVCGGGGGVQRDKAIDYILLNPTFTLTVTYRP